MTTAGVVPLKRGAAPTRRQSLSSGIGLPNLIGIGMFVSCMLVRPALLGQQVQIVGSVLLAMLGVTTAIFGLATRRLFLKLLPSYGSAVLLWFFLLSHALLNGVTSEFVLFAFINQFLCCVGAALAFSNARVYNIYFLAFINYLCLCSLSFLITCLLSAAVGLGSIQMFSISVPRYEGVLVYFPFTIEYDYREILGVVVPRLGGGFRESGITQAFYAISILMLPATRNRADKFKLVLLCIGGFATMSTTGIAAVGFAIASRFITENRISIYRRLLYIVPCIVLSGVAANFALNDDTVGFRAKENTDSYYDRLDQTSAGLRAFYNNPFGEGVYSAKSPSGINTLAALGGIGVFGLAFVLLNYACSTIASQNIARKACIVLVMAFTAFTSQPLLDAPFVYIVLGFIGLPLAVQNAPALGRRPPPQRRRLRNSVGANGIGDAM